jgi:flagellar biosynthesis protein FliP
MNLELTSIHPSWLVIGTLVTALIPLLVGVLTSFLKVSVVLSLLKSAIGTQQVPGTVVTLSLSAAVTLFIMAPTLTEMQNRAAQLNPAIFSKAPTTKTLSELGAVLDPALEFMKKHAGARELGILRNQPHAVSNTPPTTLELMTAFVLSELREAFSMGFVLLLPFLVIDLVVSNILAGMGMFMVSPALIALPLKLLFFVVSDGWLLLGKSLIASYQ